MNEKTMTKFKKAAYVMNEANQQAAMDDGYGWLRGTEPIKTIKYLDTGVLWTDDSGCLWYSQRQVAAKGLGFEVHEHYPTIDPALNKKESIMKQEFTKADLKTGMVVTLRNGNNYIVLLDHIRGDNVLSRERGWLALHDFSQDLTHEEDTSFTIIAVSESEYYTYPIRKGDLIWERKQQTSEAEIKLQELKELHEETAKKIAELSKEMGG